MSFVELREVVKAFGARQVLTGLSFAIDRGEVYGLVGPNGAGKTTTINILCGLLAQDTGTATVDQRPPSDATRRLLGVATQEIALYRDLTCGQNLEFFAGLYGYRSGQRSRVEDCLRSVDLLDRADSLVSELSGGMRRRLHIAIAILHEPALLILDEPTVGLDLASRQRVWELIRALADGGSTILLTTHQLDEAETLCRRVGILSDGRLAAEGTLAELRALIPAAELAVIEALDLDAVCHCAADRGLTYRRSGTGVTVWLPRRMELDAVAAQFRGVPIRSLSLKSVGLEEVYAELTRVPS